MGTPHPSNLKVRVNYEEIYKSVVKNYKAIFRFKEALLAEMMIYYKLFHLSKNEFKLKNVELLPNLRK